MGAWDLGIELSHGVPRSPPVLTLRSVRELADARAFARVETYFDVGAVGLLEADAFV
jgi:hypothetical protein